MPVTSAFRAAWDFRGVAVFLKSFSITEIVKLAAFKTRFQTHGSRESRVTSLSPGRPVQTAVRLHPGLPGEDPGASPA